MEKLEDEMYFSTSTKRARISSGHHYFVTIFFATFIWPKEYSAVYPWREAPQTQAYHLLSSEMVEHAVSETCRNPGQADR